MYIWKTGDVKYHEKKIRPYDLDAMSFFSTGQMRNGSLPLLKNAEALYHDILIKPYNI